MEHGPIHRGHPLEHVDAVALDDLERLGRVEARDQRERPTTADRGVQAAGLPEGVKQRQGPERDRLRAEAEQVAGRLGVAGQVGVRQLRALGGPGGAGRVEDDRRVVVVGVVHLGDRLRRADEVPEARHLDEDALGARRLGPGLRVAGKSLPREQDLRARVLEIERDLAALEQHVHRNHDAAGAQHAVVADGKMGDVGEHDPDAVAGLEPGLAQQPRDVRGGAGQLLVGGLCVIEPDGHPVGVLTGGVQQCLGEVHGAP